MVQWQWKLFDQLSTYELYEILNIRQEIFVIEQNCIYQDIDELDKHSWHLISRQKKIVAYLRIVFPNYRYKYPSIGRILTIKEQRNTGLGKQLLTRALLKSKIEYPNQPIKISAQVHLTDFYSDFGFKTVSESYDEDGIQHIEMLKQC